MVEIDTFWNVKTEDNKTVRHAIIVEIDTFWNVK